MERQSRHRLPKWILRALFAVYLKLYHRLEWPNRAMLPERGPFLVLTSHFSFLDPLVLIVVDSDHPYTRIVVRESLLEIPIIGNLLRIWEAIPVARDGRDMSAVRQMLRTLEEGRGLCVAAEGTRSRTGRLGPLAPALMRIALKAAEKGVPIIPVVGLGIYESLPPRRRLPRPHKIQVVAGPPIDLSRWFGTRVGSAELLEIGALVQSTLADLLPPERRPAPGTPVLRGLEDATAGAEQDTSEMQATR